MGATSSHHSSKWLDRNKHGTSFRRSTSLRQAKPKENQSSPRRIDKLRKSFRDSFRRRKNTTLSEASKPYLWKNDEMDVKSGTCCFHVKYLGGVEVFESRGIQVCEEALKVLKNSHRRPVKAILYVSADGLRVVEDDTKELIVDQIIEKVSFCAPDRNRDRCFSYICRDGTTRRWMCHGFLSLKESGERLSHAVGCAFSVCLERKHKRDKECNVMMNFDMQNSTFVRTGSFKQQTQTEKLQDIANITNDVDNASFTTPVNKITFLSNIATNHGTNTNKINHYIRKENIPLETTPELRFSAIERPHATVSTLQRQGSIRGLSRLTSQASPFKRQLSLRISDLPSNVERTRSHNLHQYSLDYGTVRSKFIHLKIPVSPIPEISPIRSKDLNLRAVNTVTDEVSAMCQQFSQGLSLSSKNDDLSSSSNTKLSRTQLTAWDLFSNKVNDFSQLIESKTATTSSSTIVPKSCPTDPDNLLVSKSQELMDTNTRNRNPNTISNSTAYNASKDETANSSYLAQCKLSVSSAEIPLTPPTTPLSPNSPQLPKPEQWLGKVVQLTMNVSDSLSSSSSSTISKRIPARGTHTRSYSLSSAEIALNQAVADGASNDKPDPFDIDWVSLSTSAKPTMTIPTRNTNPFLTGSPLAGSSLAAGSLNTSFEAQM